jgi:hypothetical protein
MGACSVNNSRNLVVAACKHVDRAVALYDKANATSEPNQREALLAASLKELRYALSKASVAASQDHTWDALSATIAETSRIPEKDAIGPLTQQCSAIESGAQ